MEQSGPGFDGNLGDGFFDTVNFVVESEVRFVFDVEVVLDIIMDGNVELGVELLDGGSVEVVDGKVDDLVEDLILYFLFLQFWQSVRQHHYVVTVEVVLCYCFYVFFVIF